MRWIWVQLSSGSNEEQRSRDPILSASRECVEGEWATNQTEQRRTIVHEAIA